MSRALKCDRCGQCFCPGDAEYVAIENIAYVTGTKYTFRMDNMDFCLCCSNEFKNWMKEKSNSTK